MPKHNRRLAAAAFGLFFLVILGVVLWPSHRPAPRYRVTDLGTLPGCTQSEAIAVNSRGEVILSSSSPGTLIRSAGLYQGGKLRDLGTLPGATGARANGINSLGDVVGNDSVDGLNRTLLYHNGKVQDLATLVGSPYSEFMGGGIDDRGEIAGTIFKDDPISGQSRSQMFLIRNGKMILRGVPDGYSDISAEGITAAGNIFGNCWQTPERGGNEQLFIYDTRTGKITALDLPSIYSEVRATQGNDQGQMVGMGRTTNSFHAILWTKKRTIDLGALPNFEESMGQGINNRSEIVGTCFPQDSPVRTYLQKYFHFLRRPDSCAFVYQNGKMQNLNEMIPGDSGWVLEEARSINDSGQIVGQGLQHGQMRAFLLTPLH